MFRYLRIQVLLLISLLLGGIGAQTEGIVSGVAIGSVDGIMNLGASGGGGGGYTGPGDLSITGILAWWSSARCYSTTLNNKAIVDIVDASTGSTIGTRLQCNTGGVVAAVVSASACTFVTGNACSPIATTCTVACNVVTLYDQSGATSCAGAVACNLTQTINAARPAFTTSSIGGRNCITWTGGNQTLASAGNSPTGAQPITITAYAERTSGFTTQGTIDGGDATPQIFFTTSANQVGIFAGTVATATVSDSAPHALIGVFNGASSSLLVDSTPNAGLSAGTTGWPAGAPIAMGKVTGSAAPIGITCEGGAYSNGMSTGNQTLYNSNVLAFY